MKQATDRNDRAQVAPKTVSGISRESSIPQLFPLTGLRFVAALLVYLSHIPLNGARLSTWYRTFMFSGFNGVTLFFVLSGFVICYNYYDRMAKQPRASLHPFFAARFARIYPMYLFMFLWVFTAGDMAHELATMKSVIVRQLTMTQAWSSNIQIAYSFNAVSWSVSVEVFLYGMFPIIAVCILRRLSTLGMLVAVGLLTTVSMLALATWFSAAGHTEILSGVAHFWLYRLPATRLGDFLLGCIVARICMMRTLIPVTSAENRVGALTLIAAIGAVFFLMLQTQPALVPFRFDAAYSPLFAVIIFCLARYQTIVSKTLSVPPMILLGEASYSFYLMHTTVLAAFGGQGGRQNILHTIMVLILATLIAVGAYRCIEMPMRQYIRRGLTRRPERGIAGARSILDSPADS